MTSFEEKSKGISGKGRRGFRAIGLPAYDLAARRCMKDSFNLFTRNTGEKSVVIAHFFNCGKAWRMGTAVPGWMGYNRGT